MLLQQFHIAIITFHHCDFNVRHQQVYDALPSHLKLIYSHKLTEYAPTTAILKVYGSNYRNEEPEYYVLYFYPNQKEINITVDLTSENHCPLVQTLWYLVQAIETSGKLEWFIMKFLLYPKLTKARQNLI